MDTPNIPQEDWDACLRVLQAISDANGAVPRTDRFNGLLSKVYRLGRKHDKQAERTRLDDEDRRTRAQAAMVQIQRDAVAPQKALPPGGWDRQRPARILNTPDHCYICKAAFVEVHFFYHLLCPACAAFNFQMRDVHADLTGRVALVTGGRVKIGNQLVLRLLRDGAKVLVTTRFPKAAAKRFFEEPDSKDWLHRLFFYGLDLRNIPEVERFAAHLLETEPHLDILIHNAAQTIRRPNGFYTELMAQEAAPLALMPPELRETVKGEVSAPDQAEHAESTSLTAVNDVLPIDRYTDHEERADSRDRNSWLLKLDEVSAPEMLEVQLVNNVAPFLLNARLKALLARSPHERRFIVNVSAMEGQFSRHKTVYHPHTNMAKAALNMMTRTAGEDYAKSGIYMTSVDTGWITDENPQPKREHVQSSRGFYPPLDIVDGMARIYHPVAHGVEKPETPFSGVFLKDYAPCPW